MTTMTTLVILWICVISAGQETAKQALQEIVILPALRPEVSSSYKAVVAITRHDSDVNACQSRARSLQSGTGIPVFNSVFPTRIRYEWKWHGAVRKRECMGWEFCTNWEGMELKNSLTAFQQTSHCAVVMWLVDQASHYTLNCIIQTIVYCAFTYVRVV